MARSEYKNDRKLHEGTCIFICTDLNSSMCLFRTNNTVTNFWMLFAMFLVLYAVASEVSPEVKNPDSQLFVCYIALLDLTCFPQCSAFYLPEIPICFVSEPFQA